MGVEAAIIGSALLSAGGQQIAASQGRRSQRRVAAANLQAQEERARKTRIASGQEVEAKRQADVAADRLARAKGQQISASALRQRGIAPRPISSFADVSRAVLDEGNRV